MSLPPRRQRLSYGSLRIFFGVAFTGVIVYALFLGRMPIDWQEQAKDRLAERDFPAAIAAATRALDADASNYDALFVRAQASKIIRRPRHSLDDIEAAIEMSPNTVRLISFKASLLQDLADHEGAIAYLDQEYERLDRSQGLMIQATTARIRFFKMLTGRLRFLLAQNHPERIELSRLLTAHFASFDPQGVTRTALVDVLPGSGLQEEVGTTLDRAWSLLRESDALLGDIRRTGISAPAAFLSRSEVDLHLGRLLPAKENLQTLIARSIDPSTRRRAYEMLVAVLHKSGAYAAEAAAAEELVVLRGGPEAARPALVSDVYEAQYFAADEDPALRQETLARFDAHLVENLNKDLRTLAYRGMAALYWEEDPKGAIARLREVFDALRYQRTLDASISEPERARRFVLTLLEAYLDANLPQRGLEVANVLVGLSPDDPDLLQRRARIRVALGQTQNAAQDLLAAMRVSKRDPDLLQLWLDTASIVEDTAGRTAVTLAQQAADRLRTTKAALKEELDQQENYGDVSRFRQTGARVSRTMAQIGEVAGRMAADPIVAWHMAEEFGRAGETVESRNFLFRASVREPEVGAFRFRLAQYRLDLGLYEEAARDFERILVRDPADAEAARYARQCWLLAGEVEKARHAAQRLIVADPIDGGLEVCIEARLAAGDAAGALKLLAPHNDTSDPELMLLFGQTMLAAERYPAARSWLLRVDELTPDRAEVVAGRLLAHGLGRDVNGFNLLVERFANLPRLLPAPEIERMLDRLERAGLPELCATLATRIAERFPSSAEIRLKERAALVSFRAGDATLLRRLRDRPRVSEQLSNGAVAAAFGLTLRELGPHAAANYLQAAREFTTERDWAILPTAAAFALTPFQVELTTFLGRYERSLGEDGVPGDEALLWWLTRLRAENKPTPRPEVAADAGAELGFVRENATTLRDGDDRLDELYLRFLLFAFAGRGFEDDALALAGRIAGLDNRAVTAARFAAFRTAAVAGPEAGAAIIVPVQRANPTDRSTYLLAGDLLVRSQADSTILLNYSRAGLTLFEDDLDVKRLAAMTALRAGSASTARLLLEEVLEQRPADLIALRIMAQVARSVGHGSAGAVVTRAVATQGLRDRVLRSFVLERYGSDDVAAAEAIQVLGQIVADDPTFYPAAVLLARRLMADERDDELRALALTVARAIPADAGATSAADALFELTRLVRQRDLDDFALELVDAALLAQPAHIKLRLERVDLVQSTDARGAAIDDLRLLCALSPSNPQILFDYDKLLIEERTDLADVVVRILPRLETLADGDERYLLLKAENLFRLDELTAAREALREAVEKAPREQNARYLLGVYSFLDGDKDEARAALESVTRRHPFFKRAQHIKKML